MSASTSGEPVRSQRRVGRCAIASSSLSRSQPPIVLSINPTVTKPRPFTNTRLLNSLAVGFDSVDSLVNTESSSMVHLFVSKGMKNQPLNIPCDAGCQDLLKLAQLSAKSPT